MRGHLAALRTRARAPLALVLVLMAALVTVALAGTVTYLDVASSSGVRSVLTTADGQERTVRVQTRSSEDPSGQDRTAREVLEAELPRGARVWHTLRTAPLRAPGLDAALVLGSDAGLAEHARLVDGRWVAGGQDAVLQADAADLLGLAVGDDVTVAVEDSSATFSLVGTWRPIDEADPHWAGDATVGLGTDPLDADSFGPLLVLAQALEVLDVVPFAQWTLTPDDAVEPADLAAWVGGLGRLENALTDADVDVRGLTVTGGLSTLLADTSTGLASVRAASTIPLVILGLVSLVAVWQIARLLAALRERETRLLLSRGSGRRQLVLVGALESLALAVPGAALGAGAVLLASAGRPGARPGTVWLVAAGVALTTAAVLGAVSAVAAFTGLRPTSESGRVSSVVQTGALVLLLVAAAFTLWRFSRNGSPLVPGTTSPDLVAVVAPALGLLAVALVAVALAGPLTRFLARVAGRRPGYSPVAELRQTSRHITLNAVPVILVVLATAITTVAAAYAGTWSGLRAMSAQVDNGADVRVVLPPGLSGATAHGVSRYAEVDGVASVAGVIQAGMRLDERNGRLTAMPMSALGTSSAPEAVLDPGLAELLAPPPGTLDGLEVPDGVAQVSLDVTASASSPDQTGFSSRTVDLRVWFHDGTELVAVTAGTLTPRAENRTLVDSETQEVYLEDHPETGRPVQAVLTVDVPEGAERIVAVDAEVPTLWGFTDYAVTVDAITADGTDLLAPSALTWSPATLPAPESTQPITAGTAPMSLRASLSEPPLPNGQPGTGSATLRFMPERSGAVHLPVVLTPGWAGVILPDGTDVAVNAVGLELRAVGRIAVVPGNPDPAAALADLSTLQDALLRTTTNVTAVNEVWLEAGDAGPDVVAAEARAPAGPRATVAVGSGGDADAVSAPARTVFWAAAVCALLLALPAVAAVALTQASARRTEVVVLRAVGVGAAQQGRSRRAELLGLVLGAVVAGAGAGWLLANLVVVDLVRSTTPHVSRAVPLSVAYEPVVGLTLLSLTVGAVTALASWYGRRVRSQALDTTWREEAR